MFLKQAAGSKKNRPSIFSRIQPPEEVYFTEFSLQSSYILLRQVFFVVTKAILQSHSSHKAFE